MTDRRDHFDPESQEFVNAVRLIIDRHAAHALEADIRHAIGGFLVFTGLATEQELRREQGQIDLQSSTLIVETKRRIGTQAGFVPDPANVAQLDGYMQKSTESGHPRRLGILTDGRYWLLRVPGVPQIRTHSPYGFELRTVADGLGLFEWLRDELGAREPAHLRPTEDEVRDRLATGPRFERDMAALNRLYQRHRDNPTLRVKRNLWRNLLAAALGEVIEEETDLDRLFLRHTYLSAVVGLAVQSAFGIDIRGEAAPDPMRLLGGQVFVAETGIRGVVESDFFVWPAETEEGVDWVADLATRVAAFDWASADYDVARVLYQAIIPAEERRRLGEYYTPDWLAEAIVEQVVPDPLGKRILDPSCGSGTFLRAAIRRYIDSAFVAGWDAPRVLEGLRQSVIGVDIHPVSVHLARATWVLAAREVIPDSIGKGQVTVPVYLGDSLQLHTDNGNLLGEKQITIEVPSRAGGRHRLLQFPRSLVDQGDWFDETMLRVAETIASGHPGELALDDADIPDGPERDMLEATVKELEQLHREGRDHIWAYYTRNLVRPVWLSTEEGRVDTIVGNPPWLTYSRSHSTLRNTLEWQSKNLYRIWQGGRYAPHQDIAGLFYARCVDLYLRRESKIGMVLPHSALQAGQYSKWRTGEWANTEINLATDPPWDLEKVTPNTFFPVPACVVFGTKTSESRCATPLGNRVTIWHGPEGGPFTHATAVLQDTLGKAESPYGPRSYQGATITPRRLFFVETSDEEAPTIRIQGITNVRPRLGTRDKAPWKDLSQIRLATLGSPIEMEHLYRIHLGETVAPFVFLQPLLAILPLQDRWQGPIRSNDSVSMGGLDPRYLGTRMRHRWLAVCNLWETHKQPDSKLSLLDRLDYMHNLTNQTAEEHAVRLVYTTSGRPTAGVLTDSETFIDTSLYWIGCQSMAEAHYLAAVINSCFLYTQVQTLMPKGAFGARHIHKHLWKLNVPEYDGQDPLHSELATLGKALRSQANTRLDVLTRSRSEQGKPASVTVARRELRQWLLTNESAQKVEELVERLLNS